MNTQAVWTWTDRMGLDHCAVRTFDTRIDVDGIVVVDWSGVPLETRYRIVCDAAWRVLRIEVRAALGHDVRSIVIEQTSAAVWRIDGNEALDLAGCEDVDLMTSPFTNTLPVRRLPLRTGEPRRFDVAWIRPPEFHVVRAPQEYERLDSSSHPFARRIRYRSIDSGFAAELDLDRDGLVIDYPPYWKRRGDINV